MLMTGEFSGVSYHETFKQAVTGMKFKTESAKWYKKSK